MDLQSRRVCYQVNPISHIHMVNQFLWIEWPEGDSHECKPCEMNALFANSRNFSTLSHERKPSETNLRRLNQTLVSLFNPFYFCQGCLYCQGCL